jgi:hypothetical protein
MSQELEDWKLEDWDWDWDAEASCFKVQISTGAVSAEATPQEFSPGFSCRSNTPGLQSRVFIKN